MFLQKESQTFFGEYSGDIKRNDLRRSTCLAAVKKNSAVFGGGIYKTPVQILWHKRSDASSNCFFFFFFFFFFSDIFVSDLPRYSLLVSSSQG